MRRSPHPQTGNASPLPFGEGRFCSSISARKPPLFTPKTRYNQPMQLAIFAIRLLEAMFFLGLLGSSVVVFISFFEDAKELFGKD
jgi:hypothetical protein